MTNNLGALYISGDGALHQFGCYNKIIGIKDWHTYYIVLQNDVIDYYNFNVISMSKVLPHIEILDLIKFITYLKERFNNEKSNK